MIGAAEPIQSDLRRLVDEVEAQLIRGKVPIACREKLPKIYERILSLAIEPQIVNLGLVGRDAIARGVVQVQRNVYAALSACSDVTVKGLQYRLIRVEIVEAGSPDSVVRRNANEVESVSVHEIEGSFVCRPWPVALPYEHPLEVESVVRQFDTVMCSGNVPLGIHAP